MRLLMVQHAGDYREAVQRLSMGGQENYYAQRYTVDALASLTQEAEEVGILCCLTREPYNELLANGVHGIGMGFQRHEDIDYPQLFRRIEQYDPSHIVLLFPDRKIFKWATKQNRRVMALLADSSPRKGLKEQFKDYLLANLINHPRIEWVANHGVTACAWLQAIGVNANKIVPWDYVYTTTPDDFPIKALPATPASWNFVYVGTMSEVRGVGDLLQAANRLKAEGLPFRLQMVGRNDYDYLSKTAKQYDVEDCIDFIGMVALDDIEPLMRQADLVITPTRHEYPAGFPLITYHALRSRTPFVVSDHPMFRNVLKHRSNAMMFPAGNPTALAGCIQEVLASPELYHKLSDASMEAWNRLQIPVKWADLIRRWAINAPEDQRWLYEHRLASGRYVQDWAKQPVPQPGSQPDSQPVPQPVPQSVAS